MAHLLAALALTSAERRQLAVTSVPPSATIVRVDALTGLRAPAGPDVGPDRATGRGPVHYGVDLVAGGVRRRWASRYPADSPKFLGARCDLSGG